MANTNESILTEIKNRLFIPESIPKITVKKYWELLVETLPKTPRYEDFTGSLFWDLLDKIKATPASRKKQSDLIRLLLKTFIIVQEIATDIDLLKDTSNLCIKVFHDKRTVNFLVDDYVSREKTYLFKRNSAGNVGVWTIDYKNQFLGDILAEWLHYYNVTSSRKDVGVPGIVASFEESLGTEAANIISVDSFSGITFWEQINYYKRAFQGDPRKLHQNVVFVVSFYKYLITTYPKFTFDDYVLNKSLFLGKDLTRWICRGYHIVPYNPYDEAPSWEKTVFILKGFDQYSSSFLEEDYLVSNLEKIQIEGYRKLINEYLLSSVSVVIESRGGALLVQAYLPKILRLKTDPNYPNTNLYYYTVQDAILIRRMIMELPNKLSSKNNAIGSLRRFLKWAVDNQKIICDDQFFDYLKQIAEPAKYEVNDIPEKHITILIDTFCDLSKENDIYFMSYVLFLLQLSTHFRAGTLCSLETDCIFDTMKPEQYLIRTNCKVSHGERNEYSILEIVKLLLDKVIDSTESLREEYADFDAFNQKIFIYRNTWKTIKCFTTDKYRHILHKACDISGLPRYSPGHVRNSYMTKAVEFAIKSGKSDLELGRLTKHRDFRTTNLHYLSIELDEMLEATYGVIIGDIEPNKYDDRILECFPSDIGESRIVEHGCGRCKRVNNCEILIPLFCLSCEDFVTTVEHEMFFIKEIEHIDELIKNAPTPHDVEDLNTIKKLHVAYLRAIYRRKEDILNGTR